MSRAGGLELQGCRAMGASALSSLVLLALAGCGGGGGSGTSLDQGPSVAGFALTSGSAVAEGDAIDARFTCDGEDVSPELVWQGAPEGTKELALVVEDPDAPGGTFTHWLVWDLDPTLTMLPQDVHAAELSEGENDFGDSGYSGPCPPKESEHQYVFRLLALHARLDLPPGADRGAFDDAVAPLVRAEARLTAPYARR